jgi:hypothetical protein
VSTAADSAARIQPPATLQRVLHGAVRPRLRVVARGIDGVTTNQPARLDPSALAGWSWRRAEPGG